MYLLDSTINLNNWDLGVYNIFWSKRGSGFGKPGGTPPPRTPRGTPMGGGADNNPLRSALRVHLYPYGFQFNWSRNEIIILLVQLACENICFSLLFAAGDVSRGGTSATQRQKFHTDDAKSVRNLVRSADWSTE